MSSDKAGITKPMISNSVPCDNVDALSSVCEFVFDWASYVDPHNVSSQALEGLGYIINFISTECKNNAVLMGEENQHLKQKIKQLESKLGAVKDEQ